MTISWVRPFSLPAEPAREAVFDTIASAHGTSVVTWLLDRHRKEIESASDGLTDYLAAWTQRSVSLETVWDIAFGRAHSALTTDRLGTADVAARLGLRIAEYGQPGVWSAVLKPTALMIAGLSVQNATRLDVEVTASGEGTIHLRCPDGHSVYLQRGVDDHWHAAEDVPRLRRVGGRQGFLLLPRTALPDDAGTRAALGQCQAVDVVDDDVHAVFRDGLDLLDAVLPDYVPWVTRVVHGIVACSIEAPFHLVSGSWEDVPGFIHVSSPHVAVDIAEILAHEAAHQYFYLLQRVGPLDDGSDSQLYWSPPIRMHRPLSRILMAFHALVNVLKLYKAVQQAGGANARYVEANEPALRRDLAALDAPLRDNSALTSLGRSLYEPLAACCKAVAI